MSVILETKDLTKIYSSRITATKDLNLTIEGGKIIGLLGPNGSGKTTLIKMINNLLVPTSGTITIGGHTPGVETKKMISYLPERTYLPSTMTSTEIIDYFADFYDDFSKEKAFSMLHSLGISPSAKIKTLSKGTQEKVQLILVMSRSAKLYVLDEPIAGVDPAARDYILKTIISNYCEGSSILLSTHLISDVENVLDEVIFIRNGSLVLHNSIDEIRLQHNKTIDQLFREVFSCSAN